MDQAGTLEARIKAQAAALGFAACGIARADAAPHMAARLAEWLAEGAHGDMLWMEQRAGQRGSPAALWPEVRSVIMLGMSYAPAADPLALAGEAGIGRISTYAQGQDYHDVVKKALKALARWLIAVGRGGYRDQGVRRYRAGDGKSRWPRPPGSAGRAKHSNLVSRDDGSWLLLGAIMTTRDLAPDRPGDTRCGSCDACLRACPTDAFPAPYRLDARRCISYLTIEHKGAIPIEFRAAIGKPHLWPVTIAWRYARGTSSPPPRAPNLAFAPRAELAAPELTDLLALDDAAFRQVFAGSPIKRIGRDRMVRNALIAAGRWCARDVARPGAGAARRSRADRARGAAVWALSRLDSARFAAERSRADRRRGRGERDRRVDHCRGCAPYPALAF